MSDTGNPTFELGLRRAVGLGSCCWPGAWFESDLLISPPPSVRNLPPFFFSFTRQLHYHKKIPRLKSAAKQSNTVKMACKFYTDFPSGNMTRLCCARAKGELEEGLGNRRCSGYPAIALSRRRGRMCSRCPPLCARKLVYGFK